MHLTHISPTTKGKLIFTHHEVSPVGFATESLEHNHVLTIVLNGEEQQQIFIDGIPYDFAPFSLLPLVAKQVFSFEKPEKVTTWQYTRDFYCLTDSEFEISCLGLIFCGYKDNLFLNLDEVHQAKLRSLQDMFIEEFNTVDTIQTDMLQMLLKRLIIITTRLAKEQYISEERYELEKFDLIRQFNVLVDRNYKKEHQVNYYANLLNKTPKTLTRLFAGFNYYPPSFIIQGRIIAEAKRLFCYSTLSVKEIAFELGFTDAGHFSRFFKNATDQNPSDFKKQ